MPTLETPKILTINATVIFSVYIYTVLFDNPLLFLEKNVFHMVPKNRLDRRKKKERVLLVLL